MNNGSGIPELRNCLLQPFQVNITRPFNTEDITEVPPINITSFFTPYHPSGDLISVVTSFTESELFPSSLNDRLSKGTVILRPDISSSEIKIAVAGKFVYVTSVLISFTAVGTDSMSMESEPCNFYIAIRVEDRENCTESNTLPLVQDVDVADQLQYYYGITFTVDVPVASVSSQIIFAAL